MSKIVIMSITVTSDVMRSQAPSQSQFILELLRASKIIVRVPDTASYIRGWIQMVLAPNDLFSWNNKYNKYLGYNVTDIFTCFFLAMHTTHSVHAGILKPWRGCLPWPPAFFSFYHVFSLPLSGLNWRPLFPLWGSGPPFPKMAPPFTGSAYTPFPGSGTVHSILYSTKLCSLSLHWRPQQRVLRQWTVPSEVLWNTPKIWLIYINIY